MGPGGGTRGRARQAERRVPRGNWLVPLPPARHTGVHAHGAQPSVAWLGRLRPAATRPYVRLGGSGQVPRALRGGASQAGGAATAGTWHELAAPRPGQKAAQAGIQLRSQAWLVQAVAQAATPAGRRPRFRKAGAGLMAGGAAIHCEDDRDTCRIRRLACRSAPAGSGPEVARRWTTNLDAR